MKDNGTVMEKITKWLLVISSLVFFYTSGFGSFSTLTQRALHWAFMGTCAFLLLKPKGWAGRTFKYVFALISLATSLYVIFTWRQRIFGIGEISSLDVAMGILAIVALLVAVKLSVGWGLTIVVAFFIVYSVWGPIFPGFLGHSGVKIPRLINFLYLTAEGIFGVALGISSTYIIAFVIFGSVLSSMGGGEWFVDVAYALTGRYRGGPAKTAVVASALMGTVSGSPVANVVTTGTFTIPLMKKVGFPPKVAAAVEAVASTGGMFLPPVMGAGAFIMAEYLNVPYFAVAKAALIPAVLYYVALFLITDVRAVKSNLKGLPKEELPDIKTAVFKKGYYGLPLLFLIVAIVVGWSPLKSAFWATILALTIPLFVLRDAKAWLGKVIAAMHDASRQAVPIAVACAGAGIIVGAIGVTGLGTKIANGLINFANGNLMFGLVLTMVASIILGTGMPVTAVYIICAATLVQPLVSMGTTPLAAHMFIFMFSAVAGLTPPVAITSYTAAGIAQTDPNQTAVQGFLYGLPGFIIPFIFVFSPELLMVGAPVKVALAIGTALIGICCLVAAIEGYFLTRWSMLTRIMLAVAAVLLLYPGIVTDLIAFGIVVLSFGIQLLVLKRLKA
jgi:TRAP transporter 4TM/12TM fusion protein